MDKPIILGESTTNNKENDNSSEAYEKFIESLNPKAKEYLARQSLITNREALINKIKEDGADTLTKSDTTLFKAPRGSCRHCYGIGRGGWSSLTGEVLICDCMRRGDILNTPTEEFLTIEEFLKIYQVEKPVYSRNHIRPKSLRKINSREAKLARKHRRG